jgi:hypothetical protein
VPIAELGAAELHEASIEAAAVTANKLVSRIMGNVSLQPAQRVGPAGPLLLPQTLSAIWAL